MITQELQKQASIIEKRILGVAGIIRLCVMTKQIPSEVLLDDLGEALIALKELMTEIAKEPYADGT